MKPSKGNKKAEIENKAEIAAKVKTTTTIRRTKEPKPESIPKEKKPRKNAAAAAAAPPPPTTTTTTKKHPNTAVYKFDLASYMSGVPVKKSSYQDLATKKRADEEVGEPYRVENLLKFLSITNNNNQQNTEQLKAVSLSHLIESWQSDDDDFKLFDRREQQLDGQKEEEEIGKFFNGTPGWALGQPVQSKLRLLTGKFDKIYNQLIRDIENDDDDVVVEEKNGSIMNSVINETIIQS